MQAVAPSLFLVFLYRFQKKKRGEKKKRVGERTSSYLSFSMFLHLTPLVGSVSPALVFLFLFRALYFGLHQDCFYTVLWWKQPRSKPFFRNEEALEVFCWLYPSGPHLARCGSMWAGCKNCLGPQPLCLLLLPLLCFH